jgi:hypothetical protein
MAEMTDDEARARNDRNIFVVDAMPSSWLNYAIELKNSAETLWKTNDKSIRLEIREKIADDLSGVRRDSRKIYSISRPYILLAGFALENLVKGILVFQNPSHITSGRLSRELKSHKVLELIQMVDGIELDETEGRFCQIVQDAIPYWGRYPVPLEYNRVLPEIGINNKLRDAFLRLFTRLSRQLYFSIRDGWDSGVGEEIESFYLDEFEEDS